MPGKGGKVGVKGAHHHHPGAKGAPAAGKGGAPPAYMYAAAPGGKGDPAYATAYYAPAAAYAK